MSLFTRTKKKETQEKNLQNNEVDLGLNHSSSFAASDVSRNFKTNSTNLQSVRTAKLEHICNVCGKRFGSIAKHRDHQTVHSGERNFICPHDGLAFKTKDNLNQHLKTHANVRFGCDHCGKLLKSRTTLNRHMNEHRAATSIKCTRKVFFLMVTK